MEYAENVLGLEDTASNPVLTLLSCSLAQETRTVLLGPDTIIGRIYGRDRAVERFNCSFGLNELYRESFVKSGMIVSATGEQGEVRAVELASHPFFAATLFMPQLSSTPQRPHPLLSAFLRAAAGAGAGL